MREFLEDGLLPGLPDEDYEWLRPDEETGSGDVIRDTVTWIVNIAEANHIVWPAVRDGELVPPPPPHVLDHLVRYEFSDSDSLNVTKEFDLRPSAGTIATVTELPECDVCKSEGRAGVEARYDGPISKEKDARWGFMCPACYLTHSTGRLGTGRGQYLLLKSEISDDVLAAQGRARSYWKRRLAT